MAARQTEGREIVTSGSLTCPAPELCDIQKARTASETYKEYVHRHCQDHLLGDFQGATEDAERNLGLNCFYFDHKYVWSNPSLTPFPFWEIHAFVSEWTWNEDDLEERVKIQDRTFKMIPRAADRRIGDYREMKQMELPRQLEKTTIGARAYPLFISKREYFVNDDRNYPIMIRSATALNSRDSLLKIFRRSTISRTIKRLYGIDLVKCATCGASSQVPGPQSARCPACGEIKPSKIRVHAISLIDPTRGAGGTAKDSITFRWSTDSHREADEQLLPVDDPDYNPFGASDDAEDESGGEDEDQAYSIRAVGLRTELTGQRPRGYILDDITTKDNSKTPEMRAVIQSRFDQATMQLEFGGWLLVNNTRKFTDDFAGQIQKEPLRSQFHSLHRRVYWETDEADDAPHVVDGMRYYYARKGSGKPALNAEKVAQLEKRSDFPSEYLNDPTDPKQATFKRADFQIIDINDEAQCQRLLHHQPIEIRCGLGRNVSPGEQLDMATIGVTIQAFNFWDPAGSDEKESRRGDDTFGVGLRLGRYGAIFVTKLAAGRWSDTETWNQVALMNAYNRPQWSDYEMGVDEKSCKSALKKWIRDEGERTGITPMIPMHWSHMPKSTKFGRCLKMEAWTRNGDFYILSNAGSPELIEKYISQWLGLRLTGSVAAHDDGPDATSRGIRYFMQATYQKPPATEEPPPEPTLQAGVPWKTLKGLGTPPPSKSWGETAV